LIEFKFTDSKIENLLSRIHRNVLGFGKAKHSSVKIYISQLTKLCKENLNHPFEGAVSHAQYHLKKLDDFQPLIKEYFKKVDNVIPEQHDVKNEIVQMFHKAYGKPG